MTTRKAAAIWLGLLVAVAGIVSAQGTRVEPGDLWVTRGATGATTLLVRNSAAGTGNYGVLGVGNDANALRTTLYTTSTTYTPSGAFVADGSHLQANGVGGLVLYASNGSGSIRFYAGGSSTARMTVDTAGQVLFSGGVRLTDPVAVGLTAGNNNNVDPGARTFVTYTAPATDADITGFSGGADGRVLLVAQRASLGGAVRLLSESTNSTAANRITSVSGATVTLSDGKAAWLIYDSATSRWLAYTFF